MPTQFRFQDNTCNFMGIIHFFSFSGSNECTKQKIIHPLGSKFKSKYKGRRITVFPSKKPFYYLRLSTTFTVVNYCTPGFCTPFTFEISRCYIDTFHTSEFLQSSSKQFIFYYVQIIKAFNVDFRKLSKNEHFIIDRCEITTRLCR